ncbi:beta-mannosidase [Pontibacter sp. G13]|uniref:glycoside hydrolase 5 family protein n=1 Tax=Pontibacter sp. G13 TaxID=3074898 RepID=UPI00288936D8|nr:beta-mannosidase [Pontibacter sp. G13]WNJ21586.1 beta-mannosidase [Pontibacter sp. G13]
MAQDPTSFVQVDGTEFIRNGQPYRYLGTNYWYGMHLGASGPIGNRSRLVQELDQLQQFGVRNLRIMASGEGPDSAPFRIVPSLQAAPGQYNESLWEGLDFLLTEMAKRDMVAVLCLNNFWHWSGGMAQYLAWISGDQIPYPPPAEGGSWNAYQQFTTRFYRSPEARQLADNHIRTIIGRTNSISGIAYRDDPTIMAWQLANEPRPLLRKRAYRKWIRQSAQLIRSLDPHHLISIGSEGNTANAFAGTRFKRDQRIPGIDYATVHLWVQNWGWYDPESGVPGLEATLAEAKAYLATHAEIAKKLAMPVVLEEFGISRDGNNYDPGSPIQVRDTYFRQIFEWTLGSGTWAGVNFWAFGGMASPTAPGKMWTPGDPFVGDPPHEPQGWYSVYSSDLSTLTLISEWTRKLQTPDSSTPENR